MIKKNECRLAFCSGEHCASIGQIWCGVCEICLCLECHMRHSNLHGAEMLVFALRRLDLRAKLISAYAMLQDALSKAPLYTTFSLRYKTLTIYDLQGKNAFGIKFIDHRPYKEASASALVQARFFYISSSPFEGEIHSGSKQDLRSFNLEDRVYESQSLCEFSHNTQEWSLTSTKQGLLYFTCKAIAIKYHLGKKTFHIASPCNGARFLSTPILVQGQYLVGIQKVFCLDILRLVIQIFDLYDEEEGWTETVLEELTIDKLPCFFAPSNQALLIQSDCQTILAIFDVKGMEYCLCKSRTGQPTVSVNKKTQCVDVPCHMVQPVLYKGYTWFTKAKNQLLCWSRVKKNFSAVKKRNFKQFKVINPSIFDP